MYNNNVRRPNKELLARRFSSVVTHDSPSKYIQHVACMPSLNGTIDWEIIKSLLRQGVFKIHVSVFEKEKSQRDKVFKQFKRRIPGIVAHHGKHAKVTCSFHPYNMLDDFVLRDVDVLIADTCNTFTSKMAKKVEWLLHVAQPQFVLLTFSRRGIGSRDFGSHHEYHESFRVNYNDSGANMQTIVLVRK